MLARLSALLALMLLTAAVWWWYPVRPRVAWEVPKHVYRILHFAPNGPAVLFTHGDGLTYCDGRSGTSTLLSRRLVSASDVVQVANNQTVAFHDEGIHLWHPSGGSIRLKTAGELCAVAGERVIVVMEQAQTLDVQVFDLQGKPLHTQRFTGVQRLQTVPLADGRVLALLYFPWRDMLQVIDLGNGQPLFQLMPFEPGLTHAFETKLAANLAPNGLLLALLTEQGTTVHRLPTLEKVCIIPAAPGEHFVPCEFNADGSVLVTYRWTGPEELLTVRLWRVRPGQAERWHDLEERPTFSPVGRHFVERTREAMGQNALAVPGQWVLHDINSPRGIVLGPTHQGDLCFAPDSRTLAAHASMPTSPLGVWLGQPPQRAGVRLLDVASGQPLPWFREGTKFAYFPDGRSLAILNGERLEVWDVEPQRPWWVTWGLPAAFIGLGVTVVRVGRRGCGNA